MGIRYNCSTCRVHCPLSGGHKGKGCLVPIEDELISNAVHYDLSCDVSQEYLLNCLQMNDRDFASIGALPFYIPHPT